MCFFNSWIIFMSYFKGGGGEHLHLAMSIRPSCSVGNERTFDGYLQQEITVNSIHSISIVGYFQCLVGYFKLLNKEVPNKCLVIWEHLIVRKFYDKGGEMWGHLRILDVSTYSLYGCSKSRCKAHNFVKHEWIPKKSWHKWSLYQDNVCLKPHHLLKGQGHIGC